MDLYDTRPTYLFVLPWSLSHEGGVNQVVLNLAYELKRIGRFKPLILINDWDAKDPVWERVRGLQTVRWRIRPGTNHKRASERAVFVLWLRTFRRKFRQFCCDHQIAAINAHFPGASFFTLRHAVGSMDSSTPLIASFHGSDLKAIYTGTHVYKKKWREIIERDVEVVACSEYLNREVKRILGATTNSRVIHNGLDARMFASKAEADPAARIPENFILCVARFEDQKGVDVLINAYSLIYKEYGNIDLVLIGPDAGALNSIKNLCIEKGLSNRVHFLTDIAHEEIASYFRCARIFVFPSRREAFGIVVLEAGALALPVVASRVGGIPEILTDGENAMLVEPEKPEEIAECLRLLVDSPQLARELGDNLKKHVNNRFSWTDSCHKYMELVLPKEAPSPAGDAVAVSV